MMVRRLDLQRARPSLGSVPVPPVRNRERQDASQKQIQQLAAIVPIAPPQVWLLLDPPQPFKSECLDRRGSSPYGAGLKIDDRAQMDPDRRGEALMIPPQPRLALLGSQRDREKVRIAGVDRLDDITVAHLIDRAKARGDRSHAAQAAWPAVKGIGRCSGYALRTAEQEYAQSMCQPARRFQRLEDIGSAHLLDRRSEQSPDPDDRHAVRRAQITIKQRFSEFLVRPAAHKEMQIGRRD